MKKFNPETVEIGDYLIIGDSWDDYLIGRVTYVRNKIITNIKFVITTLYPYSIRGESFTFEMPIRNYKLLETLGNARENPHLPLLYD